jgi:hypothetical protein
MKHLVLFVKLLMGHAIADFGLQSDSMAKGKNRNVSPIYIPPGQKLQICWPYWLCAHGLIHGAMVTLITGNVWLGLIESIFHSAIDFGKCENCYGIHEDQAMHLLCKVLYVFLA